MYIIGLSLSVSGQPAVRSLLSEDDDDAVRRRCSNEIRILIIYSWRHATVKFLFSLSRLYFAFEIQLVLL